MPVASPLRLGTRQSPLAMAQAREAAARLCEAHGWPDDAVELVPVRASGDRIQDRPLAEIGGKALWTKELDLWLIEGQIDAAVHSAKDVETLRPDVLTIGAVLERADVADRLLGARSISALPQGAVVGTSAPRRAAQLRNLRPDCSVVFFRGNIASRMAKLAAGEVEATFLADAGLSRLGESGVGVRLDPESWLPAPAQGAIILECRSADARVRSLLGAIDHPRSHLEVRAERRLLEGLGGSCHSAVGALSTWTDQGRLRLRAAIFSPEGARRVEDFAEFAPEDEDAPLALARRLLAASPALVRDSFTGPA